MMHVRPGESIEGYTQHERDFVGVIAISAIFVC
jgi:hypothetical protein